MVIEASLNRPDFSSTSARRASRSDGSENLAVRSSLLPVMACFHAGLLS